MALAVARSDNDFNHVTQWKTPDNRVIPYGLRIFCSECSHWEVAAIPKHATQTVSQSNAEKLFRNKGWLIGRNRKYDVCPKCQERERTLREERRRERVGGPIASPLSEQAEMLMQVFGPKPEPIVETKPVMEDVVNAPVSIPVKLRTKRTVLENREITLTGDTILELLRHAGVLVPDDAKITFTVPGGGDWSNETIDISAECPIMVKFETITEETA